MGVAGQCRIEIKYFLRPPFGFVNVPVYNKLFNIHSCIHEIHGIPAFLRGFSIFMISSPPRTAILNRSKRTKTPRQPTHSSRQCGFHLVHQPLPPGKGLGFILRGNWSLNSWHMYDVILQSACL